MGYASRSQAIVLLMGVLLAAVLPGVRATGDEFRAFWADAWHAGFKSAYEVTDMVNTAKNNNFNVIVVEVRKRGDAYYFPTAPNAEPRATDIASGYDPLLETINQAHAQGLKVYAWIVANSVWSEASGTPPSNHVTSLHPEWLMKNSSGSTNFSDGYFLDPGVPDAMTWNYNVCMDLVQHYDIDGLHLDYIRYPQQDAGYNSIALARFKAEYGRDTDPSPSDPEFSDWRRRQVTDFVKKVYVNAVALKPNIQITAATFATRSDAYTYRFQDWATWMSKGYLDANMPMNYTTGNSTFNARTDDAYNNRYGRHAYIGQGSWLNTVDNSVNYQLKYVRDKGCDGMCTFSYISTSSTGGDFYGTLKSALFTSAVSPPSMPWKASASQGIVKGTVTRSDNGAIIYNATITLNGSSDRTDGTGFYALTKMTPGTYTATCSASGYYSTTGTVTVVGGSVVTQNFTLVPDLDPPSITNVQATNIYSNSAVITWNTDEPSTSLVEYGFDTSYGNLTPEDTSLVTSHSVSLSGLAPGTVYHYRVKSKDGNNNLGVSGDHTFTTPPPGTVQDIIIDDLDPGFSLSGSWLNGTASPDKYATDYWYTSTQPSNTKSADWRPEIVSQGNYQVFVWYPQGSNRSTRAPYTVYYTGGSQTFNINQQTNGGRWVQLGTGTFPFNPGNSGYVRLQNGTGETSLNVMADAVKFHFVSDTTPPAIIGPTVSGITQTQATISWTTDEVADTIVAYGLTSSYGSLSSYSPSLTTSHSVTITGLSPGTTYHYEAKSEDAFGNLGVSGDLTFTTTPDTTPPVISNVLATDLSETGATIQWDTNESADSQVEYGLTTSYGSSSPLYSELVTVHGVTLSGLTHGTTYHYRVKSRDTYGNLATSGDYTFRTDDQHAPVFSGLQSAAETMTDGTSAKLTWTAATDNTLPITYLIYRSTTPGGEDFGSPIATTTSTTYTATGLTFGQTYYFVVRARDSASPPNTDTNTVERSVTLRSIVIESGAGGKNAARYFSLSGLGYTSTDKSTAAGTTSGILSRQGNPLYTGSNTMNRAEFLPLIPVNGIYRVYQTWGAGGPNCRNARYETQFDGGTSDVFYLDQAGAGVSQNSNQWLECTSAPIPMTKDNTYVFADDSENLGTMHTGNTGRFYADAMRIEYVGPALPAPTILTSTGSPTAISLTWSAVGGASSYKIYRSDTSGSFSFTPIGTSTTTSYTDNTVEAGLIYYYLVRAADASGYAGYASGQVEVKAATSQRYDSPVGFSKADKWNLVAVPADPVNADPLVVFSGIDVASASFQFWMNDLDGGGYQSYGALFGWTGPIVRGTPYWYMESGSGSDKTISFQGYPPTGDFELTIPAHSAAPFWIMLGTPFPAPVLASSLQFKNITKRGDVWLTWQEAFSETNPSLRIVDSNAQGWNAVDNRFISVTPPPWMGESDRFEPWWGYWLLVYDPNELIIKLPMPQ